MSVSIVKIGDTREGTRIFNKGESLCFDDKQVTFDEKTVVPVTEKFVYQYPALKESMVWSAVTYHWDRAYPWTPPEIPTAPAGVSKGSWWSRLWGRSNLPKATVVR